MTSGQTLRQWRKAVGMTQGELAQAVGVNVSYISNLEREFSANTKSGKPRASVALCDRIAKVLRQDKDELRAMFGHLPERGTVIKPATNLAELIEGLAALGLEIPQLHGDFEKAVADAEGDFEEAKRRIALDIEMMLARSQTLEVKHVEIHSLEYVLAQQEQQERQRKRK